MLIAGGKTEKPPEYPVRDVEERIQIGSDDLIDVVVPMGEVTVVGWEQTIVEVTGTIGKHITRLDLRKTDKGVQVEAIMPEITNYANLDLECVLEIRVPFESSLRTSTLSTELEIQNIRGDKVCDSLMGTVRITGPSGSIRAHTVGGTIEISGPVRRVSFESTMGDVHISGVEGEVVGTTLNGTVRIDKSQIDYLDISTMTGDIALECSLTENARLKAVSQLGGYIKLIVPVDVAGLFTLSSNGRPDAIDMTGFTPAEEIKSTFTDMGGDTGTRTAPSGDAGTDRSSLRERIESKAGPLRDDARMLGLRSVVQEFSVGEGNARIYLENRSMVPRRGDDDEGERAFITLATK